MLHANCHLQIGRGGTLARATNPQMFPTVVKPSISATFHAGRTCPLGRARRRLCGLIKLVSFLVLRGGVVVRILHQPRILDTTLSAIERFPRWSTLACWFASASNNLGSPLSSQVRQALVAISLEECFLVSKRLRRCGSGPIHNIGLQFLDQIQTFRKS